MGDDLPELERLLDLHLVLESPTLCPELKAWHCTSIMGLWEALERFLGSAAEPPFWACSWPGGQAVARTILDRPEWARGRSVLDLGCGNGIAGIAAKSAGAARVVAGDVDPLAIRAARRNALANGVEIELVLGDVLATSPRPPPADLILAGDMFYTRELAEAAEPWLRAAARAGCEVLVGDPGRKFLPSSGLEELCTRDVPVSPDVESVSVRRTTVYRLLPM